MNHVLQPQEETLSPGEPQVMGLDDESTQDALDALSSKTARQLFAQLYEEPQTPSELRSVVETSLQNVHYHLEKLETAGLIRPAGTRYSEKGKEMTVYAPASEAVVFMAGNSKDESLLRRAIARFVGALGLLAGGTLLIDRLLARDQQASQTTGDGGSGVSVATEEAASAADQGAAAASQATNTLDPALVFFLGGLFVLSVVCVWWGYRAYRS